MIKKTFVSIAIFIASLGKKAIDDDLFALSNELAYKILLSFFPFMVFLVALLGFLDLEGSPLVERLFELLPQDVGTMMVNFVSELQANPSVGLLSFSLFISVYSASNGFRAIIRGVNKAHDYKDDRSFIKKTALCAGLMLIFTFSIIVMLTLWIFSDAILQWLEPLTAFYIGTLVKLASLAIAFLVLVCATAWMYKLACVRQSRQSRQSNQSRQGKQIRHGAGRILPGACATVILWAVSSEVFGVFITRFSNISVLYGSIAGVFILIVWLNLISFFLLLGNSVNALLDSYDYA